MAGQLLLLSILAFLANTMGKLLLETLSDDLLENNNTNYVVDLTNNADPEILEHNKENMNSDILTSQNSNASGIIAHRDNPELINKSTVVTQGTVTTYTEKNVPETLSTENILSLQNNNTTGKSTTIVQESISQNGKPENTTQENSVTEELKTIVTKASDSFVEGMTSVSHEDNITKNILLGNIRNHETTLLQERNLGIQMTANISHDTNTKEENVQAISHKSTTSEKSSTLTMEIKKSDIDEIKLALEGNKRSENVTPTVSQEDTISKEINTFSQESYTVSDHVSTEALHSINLSSKNNMLQNNFSKQVTNTISQENHKNKGITLTDFKYIHMGSKVTPNYMNENITLTVQYKNVKINETVLQRVNSDVELTNVTQKIVLSNENTFPKGNLSNQGVTSEAKQVDSRMSALDETYTSKTVILAGALKMNIDNLEISTIPEFKSISKETTHDVQENFSNNVTTRRSGQNISTILSDKVQTIASKNTTVKENGTNKGMLTVETVRVKEITEKMAKEETKTSKYITYEHNTSSIIEGNLITTTENNEEIKTVSELNDSPVLKTTETRHTTTNDESIEMKNNNAFKTGKEFIKENTGLNDYKIKREASKDIIKHRIKKQTRTYWPWWCKILH